MSLWPPTLCHLLFNSYSFFFGLHLPMLIVLFLFRVQLSFYSFTRCLILFFLLWLFLIFRYSLISSSLGHYLQYIRTPCTLRYCSLIINFDRVLTLPLHKSRTSLSSPVHIFGFQVRYSGQGSRSVLLITSRTSVVVDLTLPCFLYSLLDLRTSFRSSFSKTRPVLTV